MAPITTRKVSEQKMYAMLLLKPDDLQGRNVTLSLPGA
jgi:hypothetical protein